METPRSVDRCVATLRSKIEPDPHKPFFVRIGLRGLLFGAFLVFSGIKMAIHKEEKIEPDKNPIVRFFKKIF